MTTMRDRRPPAATEEAAKKRYHAQYAEFVRISDPLPRTHPDRVVATTRKLAADAEHSAAYASIRRRLNMTVYCWARALCPTGRVSIRVSGGSTFGCVDGVEVVRFGRGDMPMMYRRGLGPWCVVDRRWWGSVDAE